MKNSNLFVDNRLNERLQKIRASHSAFWVGENELESLIYSYEEGSIDHIERLRKIQNAIKNFVKIVTGREIPVSFSSGQQSYTDGQHVVLSADIDATKLDAMVGAALHESAHCLLSNESFAFLPEMIRRFNQLILGTDIPTEGKRLGLSDNTWRDHVKIVMNVLEDRRIDLWMYENAPGYRPYYDSMYAEYWNSEKIDAALTNPKFHVPTVSNYLMFVINMTNPNWSPCMPGLKEIRTIANLTKVGLEARGDSDKGFKLWKFAGGHGVYNAYPNLSRFPKLFADAVKIVELIYKNSIVTDTESDSTESQEFEMGGQTSDLPNLDGGTLAPAQEEIDDAIDKQIKFLNHDTDKAQLSDAMASTMNQLEQTKATISEITGDFLGGVKARVIIYRNINRHTIAHPTFPFKYGYLAGLMRNDLMMDALRNGKRMGAILAHRIQITQDESVLVMHRQRRGRLDKRRIASLGMNLNDIFSHSILEKHPKSNLWMDIDFSGSMEGEKIKKAMTVAIAIAYAASKLRSLNVTIAARDSSHNTANIAILYDSRKHKFAHLTEIVPFLGVGGGTPESLCFEAVKNEILKQYGDERKFFINLSDGEPAHSFVYGGRTYSYAGEEAYRHCRQLMREFKSSGIKVLSYHIDYNTTGINYESSAFKQMYGPDARFIDSGRIEQITSTINKLLMNNGN